MPGREGKGEEYKEEERLIKICQVDYTGTRL